MSEANYQSWRRPNPHKMIPGQKDLLVPPTRMFDQLSFIGTTKYACFVLETSEGHILLDCLNTGAQYVPLIEEGFAELGLNIQDLKAVLITHGHGDHYGRADLLRERCGAKLYMSRVDYEYARDANDPYSRFPDGPLSWTPDGFLEDQVPFCLGDTHVGIVSTPGHTPGCLSFLVPVTDEGRPHLLALWGGTGVPGNPERQKMYLESCDRFAQIAEEAGVDGELTNHPFVDQTVERLALLRNIVDGLPNPFVLGKRGYKYYEAMFRDLCLKRMAETSR